MENIPLPNKVRFEEQGHNQYQIIMEPLYPGYGVTLGNSLRRIMLSSLPGAAVTAVKIRGVDHEFSSIPHVKEDVIEVILNLKQMRMRVHSDQPVRLSLKVKGEKQVTAGEFKRDADVEIVNSDLAIATLDNKSADLEMEVLVNRGRGYVPVEQREHEKLEIGMIAVDAIYTPIKTVNFEVRNVRVGQITNFDELIFHIETDGTMTGKEAIDMAAQILLEHFKLLTAEQLSEALPAPATAPAATEEVELQTPSEDDLKSLGLSNRAYNALMKNNISRISQLQTMSDEQLANVEG